MTLANVRNLALLTIATLCVASVGCRSAPESNEQRSGERRILQTASPMEKPSAEELEGNPCGNPDWAKLPPEVGQLSDAEPTAPPRKEEEPARRQDLAP
ncbi:hypothetical protein DL240_07645 [Lujinxingia litoralis]|uniref:Secreted protein n=1 Tax=Lujinxingia litoralis TaxID=2211119 RepID=A0A328C7X7_9DELT|nr:hypothetical protein [Lujinxingia litoralis]RAL22764.1 hypothetical protein DL240_07645 [Lujinxingia litoralis]